MNGGNGMSFVERVKMDARRAKFDQRLALARGIVNARCHRGIVVVLHLRQDFFQGRGYRGAA